MEVEAGARLDARSRVRFSFPLPSLCFLETDFLFRPSFFPSTSSTCHPLHLSFALF